MTVWEERRAVVRRGSPAAYRTLMLDDLWPALEAADIRPLCLLTGLIGMRAEETHFFTGYQDLAHWQQSQQWRQDRATPAFDGGRTLADVFAQRSELIVEEQVRLWESSTERPTEITPLDDRRAIYGMRRFSINPRDWPEFVRFSSEGVWLRIEQQDARILGLFRDLATTDPLEVTLLTGYHGPAHWEETRFWRNRPPDFPEDLWETGRRNAEARTAITLRSHVCLMTAHWPK
jgi:hypothetical protein